MNADAAAVKRELRGDPSESCAVKTRPSDRSCALAGLAMPVFKRLDDDEKWKSSALDDHQLDVVASLSIWTGEMTTAELSALGRRDRGRMALRRTRQHSLTRVAMGCDR